MTVHPYKVPKGGRPPRNKSSDILLVSCSGTSKKGFYSENEEEKSIFESWPLRVSCDFPEVCKG